MVEIMSSPVAVWLGKFFYTMILCLIFTKLIFKLDWAVRERLEIRRAKKLQAKNKANGGGD